MTAVARFLDPAIVGGQWPADRSATDNDLASRLALLIQKHQVPGASAALFRAGEWEVAAAGVANVTTGVNITPETVMHIGSITKVLNATSVMQLVDEGRIELTAPLKRYVPEFHVANRDATRPITIEMRLAGACTNGAREEGS
jgi:CubicO group peptidase (beta-lactamase class C family)